VVYRQPQKYLEKLKAIGQKEAERCANALEKLGEDPFRGRPGADIRRWSGPGFHYRLRVGRHRFGYVIDKEGKIVHVLRGWFK
jgi:mRNA-degrading endonuclease RelE of RelBE toxin-antitoxin system